MKKILCVFLTLCMFFTSTSCSFNKTSENPSEIKTENTNPAYEKINISFPSDISSADFWHTYARYKDTKEPIALSKYYDGCIWATVPYENKDREIEAFVVDEISDFRNVTSDGCTLNTLANLGVIDTDPVEIDETTDGKTNITRADAILIITSFIGLKNIMFDDSDLAFGDISKTDLFYNAITAAYKCGIIQNSSEFNPQSNVTREEFVDMTAKALQYASLRCPSDSNANISDIDEISFWAKDSFSYIGAGCVYDYAKNEKDIENPLCLAKPKENATLIYAAQLLINVCGICQLYPSATAIKYGFDKQMPSIDGSTSTYPFTQAVYASLFSNGTTHMQFPKQHSKTHTSYENLINGKADMLFSSHHPSNEILNYAREKGVEFELIPVALDAMVFFTNANNPATNITKEQISNIYVNNAYTNWAQLVSADALLYPYCRNSDSGSHAQMEKHFLSDNQIHPEIQKETSDTMTNILTDVIQSETSNPKGYGLGYSIYYFFNNMDLFFNTKTKLKLLAVDGILPTDETIADGSYPLSNNTYIVLRKDTPNDSPARKMVEFMLTAQGQKCVETAGYGTIVSSEN